MASDDYGADNPTPAGQLRSMGQVHGISERVPRMGGLALRQRSRAGQCDYQYRAQRVPPRLTPPSRRRFPQGKALETKNHRLSQASGNLKLQNLITYGWDAKNINGKNQGSTEIWQGTILRYVQCFTSYENPAASPEGIPVSCSHSTVAHGDSSEPMRYD